MYSVLLVANYIIYYCNNMGYYCSNLKLQKILYFVQAEFLVDSNEPCFSERIEAWNFGPVVPEVYHRYKKYGSSNIQYVDKKLLGLIRDEDCETINDIVEECSRYTTAQLVEITHHQEPWVSAYAPHQNNIITKKSIKEFFSEE